MGFITGVALAGGFLYANEIEYLFRWLTGAGMGTLRSGHLEYPFNPITMLPSSRGHQFAGRLRHSIWSIGYPRLWRGRLPHVQQFGSRYSRLVERYLIGSHGLLRHGAWRRRSGNRWRCHRCLGRTCGCSCRVGCGGRRRGTQRLDLSRFRRRKIGQDWVAIREIHLLVPLLNPRD